MVALSSLLPPAVKKAPNSRSMMMMEAAEAAGRSSYQLSAIPITIIVSIAPQSIIAKRGNWSIVGCRHRGPTRRINSQNEAAVLVRELPPFAAAPPPIPLSDRFVSIVCFVSKRNNNWLRSADG
jgi:hypothetical protein